MCLGEGVKPVFSYLFFFTCMRGAGRDLMGGFFCPIGVQRCIASRFSTTSQARLISYQILLLDYCPASQAGTRPFSPIQRCGPGDLCLCFKPSSGDAAWEPRRKPG